MHKADAVGLSWSPDDQMLASCSLSGAIFIHKRQENGEFALLQSLSYGGMVKGIDWDPIGTFLACQV
jgi:protein HIRA/HIR1